MKNIFILCITILLFSCKTEDKRLDNTFYAFNNSVRLPNAPEGLEKQAEFINDLGFDGLGGHITDEYFERRASLDRVGLKMPEIYWGISMDSLGNVTYDKKLHDIIIDSKGRNLVVALFSSAKEFMANKEEGDKHFVKGLQELADFAAPYNVKIAVYPHIWNYCETLEHSVSLAKMANRDNVGAIFNTCHLLKVEGENGWEEKLLKALPYLYMISLNGADSGNTKDMGWDRLIQPLGEGTFDTYRLIKLAKDNGYQGPFGLQTYGIKLDAKVALKRSIDTWQEYQEMYAAGK